MANNLKARWAAQGFMDQRLGKIPISSPTAPSRPRQIFLTLAASPGFSNSQRRREVCVSCRRLGRATWCGDNDGKDCKTDPAQPVYATFCEAVPELSRKLQLVHHQCVRFLKAVYGLGKAPRRWHHCHRSSKHERRRISHGTLLVDFPRPNWCHSGPVLRVC